MISITLPGGNTIELPDRGKNELIKDIIENFCPRFTPGGKIIYIDAARKKLNNTGFPHFEQFGTQIDKHAKMPDLVIFLPEKKWLFLVEAVNRHGPINLKRYNELKNLFEKEDYSLVFITAFESRKAMSRFFDEIAWGTEVWTPEEPSHLIHFNGGQLLEPFEANYS